MARKGPSVKKVGQSVTYGVRWFLSQPANAYRAGKNTHWTVGVVMAAVSTPFAIGLAVTLGVLVSAVRWSRG